MRGARGTITRQHYGASAPWSAAVTIPARNEAERLAACLDAAALSLRGRGGIVMVVNGATDDTRAVAEAWFRASAVPGVLLDEPAPPAGSGVGRARRLAIEACAARLAPGGVVLTSDADSRVAADWVDANFAELERADLICGTVLPDAEEAARLPAVIGRNGAPEGEYMALTIAACARLDPLFHDPEPTHLNAAGASLAFRMALYTDVGGIPDLAMGEDRAFAACAEARDWRVRHSARAQVVTSCRLDGRTAGGMAGALRSRLAEKDPLVDELLEPAKQTLLRAQMRGVLRSHWQGPGFGAAWGMLEGATLELRRARMRLSDLKRELPLLTEAVARLEAVDVRVSA